ncbi:hypothetical protein PISMIDRAFT_19961 [Pisolithus microcarpus 441]|uniref:Uncharacterized protein n=1 Tax=Pisolithus microcarpus 441 TaxID=765257 RepID=A0A0C9XF59_9AGAM|nr:hypothetical protein BKA83DRAFT_19961 [Pisolithus microcarpus]KIK10915.1 hypothetical protein PISMIDRAFT_19961 [Pisolithus microcarpus 441]
MPINTVFSPDIMVYCMHFQVGLSTFVLYFDKHNHEVNPEKVDDMAAMTEALTQCIIYASC